MPTFTRGQAGGEGGVVATNQNIKMHLIKGDQQQHARMGFCTVASRNARYPARCNALSALLANGRKVSVQRKVRHSPACGILRRELAQDFSRKRGYGKMLGSSVYYRKQVTDWVQVTHPIAQTRTQTVPSKTFSAQGEWKSSPKVNQLFTGRFACVVFC